MVRRMRGSRASSATTEAAPERVRQRFRERAQAFDDLYEDERSLVRLLRPGLLRRRSLAVETVRGYHAPRVLDVGCGSGRIGEFVLEAGASHYVGVDFSEPMIELARARLARFVDRVELLTEDFLKASLEGPVRRDPRARPLRLPARPRALRRAHVLAVRIGRMRGRIVSHLLAAQGAGTQGPLRVDRRIARSSTTAATSSSSCSGQAASAPVEIRSPGRSGYLLRAYRR